MGSAAIRSCSNVINRQQTIRKVIKKLWVVAKAKSTFVVMIAMGSSWFDNKSQTYGYRNRPSVSIAKTGLRISRRRHGGGHENLGDQTLSGDGATQTMVIFLKMYIVLTNNFVRYFSR